MHPPLSSLFAVEPAKQPVSFIADIINAAKDGPFGAVALVLVIIGVLSLKFFEKESVKIRLSVFFSILVMASALVIFPAFQQYNSDKNEPSVATKTVAPQTPPVTSQPTIRISGDAQSKGANSPPITGDGNTVNIGDSALSKKKDKPETK